MAALTIVAGIALIMVSTLDLLNTLVSTSTSRRNWWPSFFIGLRLFGLVRAVASRLDENSRARHRLLALFAPLMILSLLTMWVSLQIVGFGLIWWGVDGVQGVDTFFDDVYYSGVVFFTVGFGEVLPVDPVPRVGALIEAFFGVLTTALVIGYLPSFYSAYSERERMLMTLDDGSNDRITPTNLVKAWAPGGDTDRLNARFAEWEKWAAATLETQLTLPLLALFRSHDPRQNWITALGLVSDAALHAQIIKGSHGRTESYWFLRRAITLFDEMTLSEELEAYRSSMMSPESLEIGEQQLVDLYEELEAHGFELLPFEEGRDLAVKLRAQYGPQMELLIDRMLCPRGFWAPSVREHPLDTIVT